ncbi:MAG: hypothetical protein LBT20_04880 [Clostridiales bacterium]|jgi:hypothetical protein|nr:hypothetical protein [Clostridiales bacterium]
MDVTTKASINLHAVLRNMQELCIFDETAAQVVKDKKITVGFSVKGCEPMALAFDNGTCKYLRGEALQGDEMKGALKLSFSSPEKFNKLVNGEKVIPGFNLLGVTKLGFATKEFGVLSDRLAYYLQPKPEEVAELLKDKAYFETQTTLLAYTAFHALAEIGNYDPIGKEVAKRMGESKISIEVENGPAITISSDKNAHMSAKIGKEMNPKARMVFKNLKVVNDVLNGKTGAFSAMGAGLFNISGNIHVLDEMNRLLSLVSKYLA